MVVFSSVLTRFLRKFSMEYLEFTQSYKRRPNVMARCRIPAFCEKYKIDMGICDPKSKRILPRTVKQRDKCVHFQKIFIVLFGRRTEKMVYRMK